MLTFISRTIGVIVVVGLALIGADTLYNKIMLWKEGHDRQYPVV